MEEIWIEIPWYDWKYQLSNFGRVKSFKWKKERILKYWTSIVWYSFVWLTKNCKYKYAYIHRIVAEYFIPNPNNYPIVMHLDNNKKNNVATNLKWWTLSQNTQQAIKDWLMDHCYKNNYFKWKLWKDHHLSIPVNQYDLDWNFIKKWYWMFDVQRELKIDQWSISKCCKWKAKKAGGFVWEYA